MRKKSLAAEKRFPLIRCKQACKADGAGLET
jgi:hypothetical protein